MRTVSLGVLVGLGMLLAACAEGPAPGELARAAIVNGQAESGWPAVGALTVVYPGYGYGGSFCTGTLVAPQWVLTAGHCLDEHEDFPLSPQTVRFYVGSNANPGPSGWPASGTIHAVDYFLLHPGYDPDVLGDDDIGLVHLAAPVTGLTPVSINSAYMTGAWVDTEVLYVGFGVTDGLAQGGGGVKRSTTMPIYTIEDSAYVSEYQGSGICFGDSGGPGLASVGGQNKVIGVNSNVGGEGSGDPCKDFYFHTRTDTYIPWLNSVMGAPLPNCKVTPDVCFCAAACMTNGTCNNALCKTLSCAEVYDCLVACGDGDYGCQVDCTSAATDAASSLLGAMFTCLEESCGGLEGSAYQDCAASQCAAELDACLPVGTGSLSCEQTYLCLLDCPDGDNDCSMDCYEGGTAGAQDLLDAMLQCLEDSCGTLTDPDDYSECAWEHCGGAIDACLPPANCPLSGGGCPPGMACYPLEGGKTDCFDSSGKTLGQACDTDIASALDCGDGLVCIALAWGEPATCQAFCEADADCGPGEVCEGPVFQGLETVGVCICEDGDGDGACAGVDCNDDVPEIFPGAGETCDGLDNDCNGLTDEGCPAGGEDTVVPDPDVLTPPEDTAGPAGDLPPGPGGDEGTAPGTDSPAPGEDTTAGPGADPVAAPAGGCDLGCGTTAPSALLLLVLLVPALRRRTAVRAVAIPR
ncbi:MAG: trypsin-like serine protease [Deltaproteobacteria bacterium]|nr:trypsin-like serine protease [Deltaproteobacteria bacterium]